MINCRHESCYTLDKQNEIFVRDVIACADSDYQLNIRVITETPWASLFADNMFIRPTDEQLKFV